MVELWYASLFVVGYIGLVGMIVGASIALCAIFGAARRYNEDADVETGGSWSTE